MGVRGCINTGAAGDSNLGLHVACARASLPSETLRKTTQPACARRRRGYGVAGKAQVHDADEGGDHSDGESGGAHLSASGRVCSPILERPLHFYDMGDSAIPLFEIA